MKKLEKLNNQLKALQAEINTMSFERQDTSFRRKGGYFGTNKADLSNVIVIDTITRTKHLNTYVCVNEDKQDLVNQYQLLKSDVQKEAVKQAEKEARINAVARVEDDINLGVVYTNYGKVFIQGNNNIYYAHPFHKHEDYNKWRVFANTPKNWKLAQELNNKLHQAIAEKQAIQTITN